MRSMNNQIINYVTLNGRKTYAACINVLNSEIKAQGIDDGTSACTVYDFCLENGKWYCVIMGYTSKPKLMFSGEWVIKWILNKQFGTMIILI